MCVRVCVCETRSLSKFIQQTVNFFALARKKLKLNLKMKLIILVMIMATIQLINLSTITTTMISVNENENFETQTNTSIHRLPFEQTNCSALSLHDNLYPHHHRHHRQSNQTECAVEPMESAISKHHILVCWIQFIGILVSFCLFSFCYLQYRVRLQAKRRLTVLPTV